MSYWLGVGFVALPFAYYVGVGVFVVGGALMCAWASRHGPRTEHERALFADAHAGPFARLRGLIVETWWQSFAFATQFLYGIGWLRLPHGPEGAPPVLLLPGYTETAGTLWWLARKLARAGYAPVGIDYPSTFHRIERNAEYVRERIADVRARNGGEPVAVVAHSMGGIIARTVALTTPDHGIRTLLTFASPFAGTVMAYVSPKRPPSVRDMTPRSRYMQTYPPERDAGIPIRVIVAFQENIVGPPWSAALPHADTIVLKSPYGHEAPLFVDEAFVHVERWLREH